MRIRPAIIPSFFRLHPVLSILYNPTLSERALIRTGALCHRWLPATAAPGPRRGGFKMRRWGSGWGPPEDQPSLESDRLPTCAFGEVGSRIDCFKYGASGNAFEAEHDQAARVGGTSALGNTPPRHIVCHAAPSLSPVFLVTLPTGFIKSPSA